MLPTTFSRIWCRLIVFAVLLVGVFSTNIRAVSVPGVRFEQRIGETLPTQLLWRGTDGNQTPLAAHFRGKAVVLWFGYAACPQLCSVVADGMVSSLRQLQASAGNEFEVIMLSIDPAETLESARRAESESLGRYGRTGAPSGWHYLIASEPVIRATAAAAGFQFVYDERTRQYAHPSGCIVLTPEGRISAYLIGLDFASKDLAAAIAQANNRGFGKKVSDLLLVCFRGEGMSGRYGKVIWQVLGTAVFLTVTILTIWIGRMLWLERRLVRAKGDGHA